MPSIMTKNNNNIVGSNRDIMCGNDKNYKGYKNGALRYQE
jgi:hypothetical protein